MSGRVAWGTAISDVGRAMTPRRGTVWIGLAIALALALQLPSLSAGFYADDYVHQLVLGDGIAIPSLKPWSLFDFGEAREWPTEDNPPWTLNWWTSPDFKGRFFRPLTSLTLWLDHTLYGNHPLGYHVTSLLWYLGVLLLVATAAAAAAAAVILALVVAGFGTRSMFYATPWHDPGRYLWHLAMLAFSLTSTWAVETGRRDVRFTLVQLRGMPLEWRRDSDRTCVVWAPDDALLTSPFEQVFRSGPAPPVVGERCRTAIMAVEPLIVDDRGLRAIRLHFHRSLDDPALRFLVPDEHGILRPYPPPAVGATVTLPHAAPAVPVLP